MKAKKRKYTTANAHARSLTNGICDSKTGRRVGEPMAVRIDEDCGRTWRVMNVSVMKNTLETENPNALVSACDCVRKQGLWSVRSGAEAEPDGTKRTLPKPATMATTPMSRA